MASRKTTESVNFYLKHGKGYVNYMIYLQFKFDGHRLRYYLQQAVDPKRWNAKKQRVKDADARTADGKHLINDLLNTIAQVCIDAYYSEAANGTPTPAQLKRHLDAFTNQNHDAEKAEAERPTLMQLIDRFIDGEILRRGMEKSQGTIKNYKVTRGHLEAFQAKTGYRVDFETIDLTFYNRFVSYLRNDKGLADTSIGNMVKNVRTFMGRAIKEGLTKNATFRDSDFAVLRPDTDAVYLTEAEIMQLYQFDLSHNKRLEAVRDLFVFGCWVGLRFSDYSNVRPQNIVDVEGEKFIRIKTQKTGDVVYIPCNPVVLDIFSKYAHNPNKLPKAISGQKFNTYIKEAAKAAKLTEKGRLLGNPDAVLADCISSHTARRSFATNYYLQGFPVYDLMKITGHKTEKAFMTYIKISKMDAAKRMAEHNRRKNWAVLISGINDKLRVAI